MKQDEELISISDFSRLSGIKRKNLIFYDECGLLPPDRVGSNGYRYYTSAQLETVHIIRAFREMGFSLKDIKDFLQNRYPERILSLFSDQEKTLAAEIQRLQDSLRMMRAYQGMLAAAKLVDEDRIELQERERQPAFFGPEIDFYLGLNRYDTIAAFYESAEPYGVKVGYPVHAEIAQGSLTSGEWDRPNRLYSLIPNGNGCKEAGLYVIAYCRGEEHEGGRRRLYTSVKNYLGVNRLRLAGNAYEEMLIDELAASDAENRMLRVEVRVEKM